MQRFLLGMLFSIALILGPCGGAIAAGEAADSPPPEPVTTADPGIPVDELDPTYPVYKSQAEFALMIGVSVATLRNWEQGRRQPEGPAIALLKIAARHPNIVRRAAGRGRG